MRTLIVIAAAAALSLFACSKSKDDKSAKLAELCVSATEQLASAGEADGDTFMQMLQNALTACSGGCDGKVEDSCKKLETHLNTICGVSASVCESLCESAKSPSLKKYSCQAANK